eukprot:12507226-Alexandrium_andersonii.AAC.1
MTQWSTAAWSSQSRSTRSVSSTAAVSICWASSKSGAGDGGAPGPATEGAEPSSCEAPPAQPPGEPFERAV